MGTRELPRGLERRKARARPDHQDDHDAGEVFEPLVPERVAIIGRAARGHERQRKRDGADHIAEVVQRSREEPRTAADADDDQLGDRRDGENGRRDAYRTQTGFRALGSGNRRDAVAPAHFSVRPG